MDTALAKSAIVCIVLLLLSALFLFGLGQLCFVFGAVSQLAVRLRLLLLLGVFVVKIRVVFHLKIAIRLLKKSNTY